MILTLLVRLPWWWLPAAFALPLAVAMAAGTAVPWWAWAVALAVLLLIYGGGIVTRVPLYLSNRAVPHELALLVQASTKPHMCDLGSGLGGPLIGLAKHCSTGTVVGVESSPFPWLICRLRCLRHRNAHIHFGDLFTHDVSSYDLVYAFLSPAPMPRLWQKAKAEMRPGSLFVSNTFAVPDVTPAAVIAIPGRTDARLFVYRM